MPSSISANPDGVPPAPLRPPAAAWLAAAAVAMPAAPPVSLLDQQAASGGTMPRSARLPPRPTSARVPPPPATRSVPTPEATPAQNVAGQSAKPRGPSLGSRLSRTSVWPHWALLGVLILLEAAPWLRTLARIAMRSLEFRARVEVEPELPPCNDVPPGLTFQEAEAAGYLQVRTAHPIGIGQRCHSLTVHGYHACQRARSHCRAAGRLHSSKHLRDATIAMLSVTVSPVKARMPFARLPTLAACRMAAATTSSRLHWILKQHSLTLAVTVTCFIRH